MVLTLLSADAILSREIKVVTKLVSGRTALTHVGVGAQRNPAKRGRPKITCLKSAPCVHNRNYQETQRIPRKPPVSPWHFFLSYFGRIQFSKWFTKHISLSFRNDVKIISEFQAVFEDKKNCYLTRNCEEIAEDKKHIANHKAWFSQCCPQTSTTWSLFEMRILEPHPGPKEPEAQFGNCGNVPLTHLN